MGFNWTCPHCERAVTITDDRLSHDRHELRIESANGYVALKTTFLVCPNNECRRYTLKARLVPAGIAIGGNYFVAAKGEIASWQLLPWGSARSFPDYVPQGIRNDYEEACSIQALSPKAAATLARRATQGIVRDYWGIVRPTLNQELIELQSRVEKGEVTPETWENIDVVRSVGNIGAHMEKDINVIVDVDPEEADLLIKLVETLIIETYIARHNRQQHTAKLKALKDAKQAQKLLGRERDSGGAHVVKPE